MYYRLTGGGDNYGRVEVSVNGKWGTVCDQYWDSREAHVFCKQLGFSDGDPYTEGYMTTAPARVWKSNFRCTGKENNLNACAHEGWTASSPESFCYQHVNDAGVYCYKTGKVNSCQYLSYVLTLHK